MPSATIFISYRHGKPSTETADKLRLALAAVADDLDFDIFMDAHDVEPSDLFDQEIIAGLDRTTHFIALLDNAYWASEYCRKELARAVNRFERKETIRLLFVQSGAIKPEYMTLDKDRAAGRIVSKDPLFRRIGDVQFLGPFDDNRRLVRLQHEDAGKLDDQISILVDRLVGVLPAGRARRVN